MKFKQLLVSLLVFAPLSAQASNKAERWFDIEVILFSQLAEKNQLSEHFDDPKPLPHYKKINDLLTPYLQPDITTLKNLLPVCGVQKTPQQFNINTSIFNGLLLENKLIVPHSIYYFIDDNEVNALVSDAYQRFSKSNDINVNDINLADHDNSVSIHPQLCRLSAKTIIQLSEADSAFTADTIAVNTTPNQIDAIENVNSNEPYLLSQESLTLHEIYKKLKSSRQFKPLLHLGWRQPAVSKKRAVPMRLFAGENFKNHHQILLKQFLKEQKAEAEQESLLQEIFSQADSSIALNRFNKKDTLVQQAQIDAIIKQLSSNKNDADQQYQVLTPLDVILEEQHKEVQAPIAPAQDWTIDGYFNVHLNHYLYITADFMVTDKSLAALNSQRLISKQNAVVNSVRFEQNKRVISQEIHYFDHPYMGMIVQIRRYKKP